MTMTSKCSDCYLRTLQLTINEPVISKTADAIEFAALLKECSVSATLYPVTLTTTVTDMPTSPATLCKKTHTIQNIDTPNSIASLLSVSTDNLLIANNIPINLNNTLPANQVLCLDTVPQCLIHRVDIKDTCSSLLQVSGGSANDIMLAAWNPTLGFRCRNLPSMIGKYVCVSPPGQVVPFLVSSSTVRQTTAATDANIWTLAAETVTAFSPTFTTHWPFPTQSSLVSTVSYTPPNMDKISAQMARKVDCPFIGEGDPSWDSGLSPEEHKVGYFEISEQCQSSWDPYCYPAFTAPILPSPTNIAATCYPTITTILPDSFVGPPAPTAKGTSDICNKWVIIQAGDTCNAVQLRFQISRDLFYAWNPSLNQNCGNLIKGQAYCVRVLNDSSSTTTLDPPGPTSSGASTICAKWILMKRGDTCDSIAKQSNIIIGRFRQLNRGVSLNCDNLVVGNAYCVAT